MDKIRINMVKTDKGCFISDCDYKDGYSIQYHRTGLDKILFDGELPVKTFVANWKLIKKYPDKIQTLKNLPDINKVYEIKDKDMISVKLKEIISTDEYREMDEDLHPLYQYKGIKQEPALVDIDCEIDILMEVDNFEMPTNINYNAIGKSGWNTKNFSITNENIKHQLFDRMIFAEIMLHTRPCSISSQNLFCLVRQHILENIENKVAKITSNYDFCFTVQKLVPLIEPVTLSYSNIFATTKKERNKIQYETKKYKEIEIFQMTHDQAKYQNYTVINPIFADNETELKQKIDDFLETLINLINKPLYQCECCNGTGYTEEIKRIPTNNNLI